MGDFDATRCHACGTRRRLAYTAAEAADLLGVSERHVRHLVETGDLPRLDFVGGALRIPAIALEARCAEAAGVDAPDLRAVAS